MPMGEVDNLPLYLGEDRRLIMAHKWQYIYGLDSQDPKDGPFGTSSVKLPNIPTASLPAAAAANEGNVAYDSTLNAVVVSDGGSWTALSTTAGVGTLQQVTTAGATSNVASLRFSGSAASATSFGVGGAAANDKVVIYHDGTDGHVNTLAGDLHLEPAGLDTYVTGDIYVSADAQVTGAVNGATGTIGACAITATALTVTGPAVHASNTQAFTPVLIRKTITHGDEDGDADVLVYNANSPKMTIVDCWLDNDVADGAATTGALRTAAASGGTAITSEMGLNTSGVSRTTEMDSQDLAAGSSLYFNVSAALTNYVGNLHILAIITA